MGMDKLHEDQQGANWASLVLHVTLMTQGPPNPPPSLSLLVVS